MITWPSMAFIFPPGQMLTYKTQLHFQESQATCVFAQTPCKALGGASHSGHSPAGWMKFSGLGCLEVGPRGIAGEPEITGMEASEFGRCGAVYALGTWVKTLTTCCRRPSPPPLSLKLSSVKWAITPRAHPPGSEHPPPLARLQLRPRATLLPSLPGLGPAYVTSEGLCFPTCQRAKCWNPVVWLVRWQALHGARS